METYCHQGHNHKHGQHTPSSQRRTPSPPSVDGCGGGTAFLGRPASHRHSKHNRMRHHNEGVFNPDGGVHECRAVNAPCLLHNHVNTPRLRLAGADVAMSTGGTCTNGTQHHATANHESTAKSAQLRPRPHMPWCKPHHPSCSRCEKSGRRREKA